MSRMRYEYMHRYYFHPLVFGLAGVLIAAVIALAGNTAGAISNVAPDPSEYGTASGSVGLILNNSDSSPNVTKIVVPLYVQGLTKPTAVTIGMTEVINRPPVVKIAVCVSGPRGSLRTGITTNTTFVVQPDDFVWDAVNQLWRSTITIATCTPLAQSDTNYFQFRLVAPSTPTRIMSFGYTPPADKGFFSTDSLNGSGFANYSLQFATPCDVYTGTSNSISIYDLDDGDAVDNYSGRITVGIDDVSSGSPIRVPITTSGSMATTGTYVVTMAFQPKGKYILRVNNIYHWNVLRYQMPYDNIAYLNGCPSYSVAPSSFVQTTTTPTGSWATPKAPVQVRPGDWVRWAHTITGESGGWYGRKIGYEYKCSITTATGIKTTYSNAAPARSLTMGMTATDNAKYVYDPLPKTGDCTAPYQIKKTDIGSQFCHWIRLPVANQEGDSRESAPSCVTVMVNGYVTPTLKFTPATLTILDGAPLTVDFGVENNTIPLTAAQVCYKARIWYEKSTARNEQYDLGTDDMYFSQASTGCGEGTASPANIHNKNKDPQRVTNDTRPVDITKGGRICADWFIGSLTPSVGVGGADNPLHHCITIGKQPTAQVWGNDLRVGSAFIAANNKPSVVVGNLISAKTGFFGTWGEYSVMAPGKIENVASGSGLVLDTKGGAQSQWSYLTFANTPLGTFGNYTGAGGMGAMPDIASYLRAPGRNLNGATRETMTRPVTIGTGTGETDPASLLQSGGSVLIATGTVTIAENIAYSGTSTEANIQQVVIIAPKIEIKGNVTQVDAWLITTGELNTCTDGGKPTAATCNNPLVINGAVTANTLQLRRTARGDSASLQDRNPLNDAAETMNLRGDAYIWAHNISVKNGTWTTRAVTELPPRY